MPWQDLLSPAQRVQVLALPTSLREYEELYTLTPADRPGVYSCAPDRREPAWRCNATLLPAASRPCVDAGGDHAGGDAPVHRATG